MEGDGGLTGGSRRRKKNQKKTPASAAVSDPAVAPTATSVAAVPSPSEGPSAKPEPKIEEEFAGLGLGKTSRQRQRKPKFTPVPDSASGVDSPSSTSWGPPLGQPAAVLQRPQPTPPSAFQQGPQPTPPSAFQQRPQPTPPSAFQQGPQPTPPSAFQQGPQPTPPSAFQQRPQPTPPYAFQQGPQPTPPYAFQQGPQPTPPYAFQQGPQPTPPYAFQQGPQPTPPYAFQQGPQPTPQSASQQRPLPTPSSTSQQRPQPSQTQAGKPSKPEIQLGRLAIPHKIPPKPNMVKAINTRVLTNYLAMNIQALQIYRYDVTFQPDKPKKLIPRAFVNMVHGCKFRPETLAFDQAKNCYSLKKLPIESKERFAFNTEVIDNNGRPVKFEVSIKFTGIVDFKTIIDYMKNKGSSLNTPAEAIQAVDVILRQATLQDYVKAGRQFFRRPDRPLDLTSGLEMWTGLFQSAIFTSRAFINIDVAHKGFPKCQQLVTCLTQDFGLTTDMLVEQQRNRGVDGFKSYIKNLRVVALIGGDISKTGQKREYICNDLVDAPSSVSFVFTDPNGKQTKMTVAEYFTRVKGIRLKYPKLNCVWVGPRDKNIFYPMELLEVSYGQVCNKQMNEMQLSTMVKTAASPPNDRRLKIEEIKAAMKYSSNKLFKSFGLEISDEFVQVDAKILAPPILEVGGGQKITPRNGSWQARGLQKAQSLESWGIIAVETSPQCNFESIIQMIGKTGTEMGMRVEKPKLIDFNVKMMNLNKKFLECVERNIKLLFIIVSQRGRDYYQRVKRMAERDVGLLTQCIKEFTATRKMNPQTVKNILLKVNSKLMGVNQVVDKSNIPECLKGGNVMVVGADVTHPSPDQQNVPSIAAVTASMDYACYTYNIELSVQTPKREMIMDFEEMMLDHLKVYKEKNNRLPTKIYYFRDGVSEGQFAQVMSCEIPAMTRAYARMAGPTGSVPEILFLLVQKRHHTRFFVGNRDSRNVEPGTVVDTDIVHASELDFYLVSHQAIKGTARPTRYHAVRNDSKIPSDQVEQLAFYLCHLFSRCMRSVSYPTPTYYAHLACMRAKHLTYGDKFDNRALETTPVRLRVLRKMLDFSRMFFV